MPFVNSNGELLTSIELAQVPVMAPTFQLRQRIGYYEDRPGIQPTEDSITWAGAHVSDFAPSSGNRTDLASVPSIFWSLIASYGRQTAPAIVHDAECWRVRESAAAGALAPKAALAERERIDRAFRLGLRELGVAPFRAWLMWVFVSFERYLRHSISGLVLLLLVGVAGLSLVAFSAVAGLAFGLPIWVSIVAFLFPLLTSAVAGRRWVLLVWASYAGALMLPVVVLQVAAYLPYLAVENIVWALVDLPKGKGSIVVGPTDVRNLQRSAE